MTDNGKQIRQALESLHGEVLGDQELFQTYQITAWIIPGQVVAVRRIDGVVGSLMVQDGFYFNFQPAPSTES